jgi:hypothetical protein
MHTADCQECEVADIQVRGGSYVSQNGHSEMTVEKVVYAC